MSSPTNPLVAQLSVLNLNDSNATLQVPDTLPREVTAGSDTDDHEHNTSGVSDDHDPLLQNFSLRNSDFLTQVGDPLRISTFFDRETRRKAVQTMVDLCKTKSMQNLFKFFRLT